MTDCCSVLTRLHWSLPQSAAEHLCFPVCVDVRQRIGEEIEGHLTKYRVQYRFVVFLLACLLWYSSNSCTKLCMIIKCRPTEPVLNNVTLYPKHPFSSASAPKNRYYAVVSGNILHITTGDFGTRIEIRKWGRKGATGGSYAEFRGKALCLDTDCPPVTSSGDYIGIPMKYASASKVVVMYTIFLLPTLEERARGCIFDNVTNVHITQIKTLWGEVVQCFCIWQFVALALVMVAFVTTVRDALKLRAQLSLYSLTEHQNSMQGEHFKTVLLIMFCSCVT